MVLLSGRDRTTAAVQDHDDTNSVGSHTKALHEVWDEVVAFSPIDEPLSWMFRAGMSYPKDAWIEGRGVGAIRYCNFNTGSFVEPITVWDEPNRLAFNVEKLVLADCEVAFNYMDYGFLYLNNEEFEFVFTLDQNNEFVELKYDQIVLSNLSFHNNYSRNGLISVFFKDETTVSIFPCTSHLTLFHLNMKLEEVNLVKYSGHYGLIHILHQNNRKLLLLNGLNRMKLIRKCLRTFLKKYV